MNGDQQQLVGTLFTFFTYHIISDGAKWFIKSYSLP